ncbi:MAG TPA: hypothetical protein VH835_08995 [Dongiaceae bacterium]
MMATVVANQRTRRTLALLAILAASGGCISYPDGRPIGVGSPDALLHAFGFAPSPSGCRCRHAEHAGPRHMPRFDEAVVAAVDEIPLPDAPEGGEVVDGPWLDAGSDSYESCDDLPQAAPHACPHDGLSLRSIGRVPCQCFAETANFCVPAASCGPPEYPPPGRFHPVPTQPVFAPRHGGLFPLPAAAF